MIAFDQICQDVVLWEILGLYQSEWSRAEFSLKKQHWIQTVFYDFHGMKLKYISIFSFSKSSNASGIFQNIFKILFLNIQTC